MSDQNRHLDAASWRALLDAPRQHQALVEHLAAGCDTCDEFLARHVDGLDGATDRALMALSPRAEAPLDELRWHKVRRQLGRGRSAGRLLVFVALAAGLALTVGVMQLRADTAQWNGVKGAPRGPGLEIAAARRTVDNGFVRLDDGATLRTDSVLIFRATSTVEGPARVFLQRGHTAPVEVGVTALQAGTHEIQSDSGLLGVTLEGERGEVAVWVVVGETPFSEESAQSAINFLGTPELGVARVRVHVE